MRIATLAIVVMFIGAPLTVLAQALGADAPSAQTPNTGAQPPPAPMAPQAPPAAAENAAAAAKPSEAQPPSSARFSLRAVAGGFLRFDNETGQVAFCSARTLGWTCEMAAEDRAALEKEIGRLQDEVAGLKREIASLREPPPPRPPADLSPAPPANLSPSGRHDDAERLRHDMERARLALENAWQRLVDMLVHFQKDMMRKG